MLLGELHARKRQQLCYVRWNRLPQKNLEDSLVFVGCMRKYLTDNACAGAWARCSFLHSAAILVSDSLPVAAAIDVVCTCDSQSCQKTLPYC